MMRHASLQWMRTNSEVKSIHQYSPTTTTSTPLSNISGGNTVVKVILHLYVPLSLGTMLDIVNVALPVKVTLPS